MMLNLTDAVEDVVKDFRLNLPVLNIETVEIFRDTIDKLPKSDTTNTLLEAVECYERLNGELNECRYNRPCT